MSIILAILAAILAALVVVLTKAGLKDVNPHIAFAIQSVLILVITWGIVLFQGGVQQHFATLGRRPWIYLITAGVCTTLSTVCSYAALKLGDATLVSPIERLSLVLTVVLSVLFLKEKMPWQAVLGIVLMTGGAILVGVAKK